MKATRNYLAFDLGASSGRAILGSFDGKRLTFAEKHRFPNGPAQIHEHIYWDILGLQRELRAGLSAAGVPLAAVGIDTWGVDYGVVGANNALADLPVHYRDDRTDGMPELADRLIGNPTIYNSTGIAFMKFNTMYQLMASHRGRQAHGDKLLFMPDLLAWMLTGRLGCEYTIASTSQLLNAAERSWDRNLIEKLGLPCGLFLPLEPAGTVRGGLTADWLGDANLRDTQVVAVAGHDTASAVAAVPAHGEEYAYLSSGTWSLIGFLSKTPVITADSLRWNYTNEGGADGNYRILKNIMGLWILQECLRVWKRKEPGLGFATLVELAEKEPPFRSFIEPDDDRFFTPGDMTERVREYCRETNQPEPGSIGAVVRCVLESLALKYRWAMGCIESLRGSRPAALHIVGGGCQNRMLNRFTANALGMPVVCGPSEATAIGNLLVQALALGDVGSFAEIREVVRTSFPQEVVEPQDGDLWLNAYGKFLHITGLTDPLCQ